MTTELPSYAFAVAIRGSSPTSVRGAFVFEQALTPDSRSTPRSARPPDGGDTTAALRFLDSKGTVVATTLDSGLGEKIPDDRLANLSEGLHHIGDDLVVSADVPVVGWRVVFTQRKSEFVAPLAGPLQTAGLVLVLLLLAVGILLTGLLAGACGRRGRRRSGCVSSTAHRRSSSRSSRTSCARRSPESSGSCRQRSTTGKP